MDTAHLDEDKLACANALRHHLKVAKSYRLRVADDTNGGCTTNASDLSKHGDALGKRLRLREWQADRLARSYADLLASEHYGHAAHFFLSDLYGPKDFSSRDEEVERILPLLISLLPLTALQTLTLAIEVDALTEELDAAMVAELDRRGAIERIDETVYAEAYRTVGRRDERAHQISLIRRTGDALEQLAGKPLLTALLKLMKGPAHLAGLGDLHAFLAEGFDAFRRMGNASDFLDCIEERELKIFRNLFDQADHPFDL